MEPRGSFPAQASRRKVNLGRDLRIPEGLVPGARRPADSLEPAACQADPFQAEHSWVQDSRPLADNRAAGLRGDSIQAVVDRPRAAADSSSLGDTRPLASAAEADSRGLVALDNRLLDKDLRSAAVPVVAAAWQAAARRFAAERLACPLLSSKQFGGLVCSQRWRASVPCPADSESHLV